MCSIRNRTRKIELGSELSTTLKIVCKTAHTPLCESADGLHKTLTPDWSGARAMFQHHASGTRARTILRASTVSRAKRVCKIGFVRQKKEHMKIAIFGGSFNPLHIGHANVAETLVKEYFFDKVIFVPTFIPPHKNFSNAISAEKRFGMVSAFCADEKYFQASNSEIARGGISYTIDTVNFVLEQYKNVLSGKPALVMGSEQAAEFEKWKNADELANITDIFIAKRKKESGETRREFQNTNIGAYVGDLYEPEKAFPFPHTEMQNEMIALSSTSIREKIAQKKSWRYLVPESVFKYIVENKLYGI